MDKFPINWDIWLQQDSDWRLSGESIVLMDKIRELPVFNDVVRVANQYKHERHNDSCTKFAPYNIWCTMFDREISYEEIDEVEKISLDLGWEWPWNWRSSTYWFDSLRKYVNANHEEYWVSKRNYNLFSEVFDLLMEKRVPIWISIQVDSNYWKDIKDWVLNWDSFKKNYWHADVIMQMSKDNKNYTMLDSVGWVTYKISKTKFKKLFDDWNIRAYWYCLLPLKIINMPELATNLPQHILASETKDPADKEIIVAWETEASVRLNNGWDVNKLYKNYKDKHAITRMLIDLKFIRSI